MRKLILSLVFVLATGTVMNANSTNEELLPTSKEAIEIVEDFGCAGGCVRTSKRQALEFTEDWSDDEALVDNYMILYTICIEENC